VDFNARHDCCVEPALAPGELRSDPHLAARGLFFDLDVGGVPVGQFRTPVTPPASEGTPEPAPAAGQHTDVILGEAGVGADEIRELRGAGVVR